MSEPLASLWPTQPQEKILDIVVGPERDVAAAFADWQANVDLSGPFEYASFRLLPLMFSRLRALGVTGEMTGRLRGIYRKSWYETQTLTHAMAPLLRALHQRGIRTLLIKGAALQRTYYRNDAVRPMRDLDIVVEPDAAADALSLFHELGWTLHEMASREDLVYRHSMMFRDAEQREVDLHWHLMREACSALASRDFWAHARPLTYGGVETMQLGHADMLLHTVIHGLRANREPPLRWIPDAITVIRTAGEALDWDRVLERAAALRLNARLGMGLGYLQRRFQAPVPREVMSALNARRPTLVERIENSVVLRDADLLYERVATKPWVMFAEYTRVANTTNPLRFIEGFSHYLRYRSGARGRAELVTTTLRGVTRRIGHAVLSR